METQNLIFANLQKIREKQNLGAIEDAVNEVKSNLKDLSDNMVGVTRQLELAVTTASESMSKIISDLSDVMRQTDDEFYTLQQEAFVQSNELDNLGIPYDIDLDQITGYFSEVFDKADSMI